MGPHEAHLRWTRGRGPRAKSDDRSICPAQPQGHPCGLLGVRRRALGKRPRPPDFGQPERTLSPWQLGMGEGRPHAVEATAARLAGTEISASGETGRSYRQTDVVWTTWRGRLGDRLDLGLVGRQPSLPTLAPRARFCRAIPMVELGKRAWSGSIGQRRQPLDGGMGAQRCQRPQLVQPAWGMAWDIHPGEGPDPRREDVLPRTRAPRSARPCCPCGALKRPGNLRPCGAAKVQ